GHSSWQSHLAEPPSRSGPDPVRTAPPSPHQSRLLEASGSNRLHLRTPSPPSPGPQPPTPGRWAGSRSISPPATHAAAAAPPEPRVFAPFAAAPDPGRFQRSPSYNFWSVTSNFGTADASDSPPVTSCAPSTGLVSCTTSRSPEEPLPTAPAARHDLPDQTPAANVPQSPTRRPRNEGRPSQDAIAVGLPHTAALPRSSSELPPS
ncbi:unnamed protein product, partial [Ixodes pacificus]